LLLYYAFNLYTPKRVQGRRLELSNIIMANTVGILIVFAGFENWYIPEAKVYHVGSATTGTRYNKKKVFLAARNTIFVIYKNMPVLQLALNVPFIFIGMFIKTLFFVRKGFGEDYCKGILEGICDCKKCWKVKFRMKNLSNYFKIQLELWCNLVRII
jgi:hypothetical protein